MRVEAFRQETARGPALYVKCDGRQVAFLEMDVGPDTAMRAAISLWEGIAGNLPRGMFARWRWRRDLGKLRRGIAQAIEEEAYRLAT